MVSFTKVSISKELQVAQKLFSRHSKPSSDYIFFLFLKFYDALHYIGRTLAHKLTQRYVEKCQFNSIEERRCDTPEMM